MKKLNINFSPKDTKAEELMSTVLGRCIGELMVEDENVIALDADVGFGKLIGSRVIEKFPDRFIDVGIAEANMIGIACGLSQKGKIPFTYTFGCFASRRALDQIYISGAFGGAQVKMIGSMPGITADINGGTHMAIEDIAIMRTIPKMTVVEPSDMIQGEQVLRLAKNSPGMFYIRWERKAQSRFYEPGSTFELGKAVTLHEGKDITIIASGYLSLNESLKAAEFLEDEGLLVRVIDMFTLKPIDRVIIQQAVLETGGLVTVENHNVIGGLGSAVSEVMAETEAAPLEMVGIRDKFGEVGDLASLKEKYGLTAQNIVKAAKRVLVRKQNKRNSK